MELEAFLNHENFVRIKISYDLANIFESDLYAILKELNRQVLPSADDIPEQISNRVFSLICNRIVPLKKPIGLVLAIKTEK